VCGCLSVSDVAYRKQSFISVRTRRGGQKRRRTASRDSSRDRWTRRHTDQQQAVDGCSIISNVHRQQRAVLMIDLQRDTSVSGVVIVTRQPTPRHLGNASPSPRRRTALTRNVSEYKHVLADIPRSCYVAIASQPVHRLQIRRIVHN